MCWWDCWKDMRSRWDGWERTCACAQCQVRQRARHDTWMTIVSRTQRCAILSLAALEPLVFAWWNVIMLCNSVRAVFVGVLFSLRLAGFFLQATETCPKSEHKIHQSSGLEEWWEFQLLVFQWVWSHFDDEDEAVCRLARDQDEEPPTCFRVNRAVVFFDALEWLSFSLSYLLTAENGSIFFLRPVQVLVVQSFAFFFRLSKVRSLIERLLRPYCI